MTKTATASPVTINPELDLVIDRVLEVSPELVWKAWTDPELLKQWFAPRPWTITECAIDLRPGGLLKFTMRSPEGQEFPNASCVLEAVPNERLVFTDTLSEGYRPSEKPFFSAVVEIIPEGKHTRYRAIALHGNPETRKQHEEMGFHEGWNATIDQMVELIKSF